MRFTGFGRDVPDKINSWGLPERVRRALLRELMPLVDGHPTEFQCDDGMFYAIRFEDDEVPGDRYSFNLHLARNDDSFWVEDISGYGMNGDGRIGWDSESPIN